MQEKKIKFFNDKMVLCPTTSNFNIQESMAIEDKLLIHENKLFHEKKMIPTAGNGLSM